MEGAAGAAGARTYSDRAGGGVAEGEAAGMSFAPLCGAAAGTSSFAHTMSTSVGAGTGNGVGEGNDAAGAGANRGGTQAMRRSKLASLARRKLRS